MKELQWFEYFKVIFLEICNCVEFLKIRSHFKLTLQRPTVNAEWWNCVQIADRSLQLRILLRPKINQMAPAVKYMEKFSHLQSRVVCSA